MTRACATFLLAAAAVVAIPGCASLPAARVALPAPLSAHAPELLQGLGHGRSGSFTLGPATGTYSRGHDRVELLSVVNRDSASVDYTLVQPGGARIEASCGGNAMELARRGIAVQAKPLSFACEWRGAHTAHMTLHGPMGSLVMKAERSGRFTMNGLTLDVRSLHEVEGSALPLEAPIGYLFQHNGRPVGAVEINGSIPRLWRPPAGDAFHDAVTLAGIALALLWDPAAISR